MLVLAVENPSVSGGERPSDYVPAIFELKDKVCGADNNMKLALFLVSNVLTMPLHSF